MKRPSKITLLGYMRVSTHDQKLELQRDALVSAGVHPRRLYDDKLSGARGDGPGLKRAVRDSRPGDVLVVWRPDRLGRSLKDLIAIAERLEGLGVGLRSLQEKIDTATGRLFFHLMGALAEFERNFIRERTRAGLAAARRRGKVPGRKKKLSVPPATQLDGILEWSRQVMQLKREFVMTQHFPHRSGR